MYFLALSTKGPGSSNIPIAISTPSTQLPSKQHSSMKESELSGEMVDSRAMAGKVQVKSGTLCCARKQGNAHRMMGTYQKNAEASLKKLQLEINNNINRSCTE